MCTAEQSGHSGQRLAASVCLIAAAGAGAVIEPVPGLFVGPTGNRVTLRDGDTPRA
jgi:hypothetical protein